MPCLVAATYTVVALLTAPANQRAVRAVPVDSAAVVMILDEMRAFYRDLDNRNWTPLLNHFLPAKVTARWAPPTADLTWASLLPPAADGSTADVGRCAARMAVAIVGGWARVRVRRCAAVDEAWLLRVSGHWRIVHLDLAPASVA